MTETGLTRSVSIDALLARREMVRTALEDLRDFELHGFVRFRGFKNGNAHLTFLRLDLVDKLNKIIAKRFPNALPPSREAAE